MPRSAAGSASRHSQLGLAVNISARQFQEKDLVATIAAAVEESGMAADLIELELTESVIMRDAPDAARRLKELTALGLRLAIDDFGTGYSSLGYPRTFPIHSLKIDRSFVRDVDRDPNSAALAEAIIAMAASLKLKVVAEGVETREQLERLKAFGCQELQGYIFSKPLPPDELLALLEQGRRLELHSIPGLDPPGPTGHGMTLGSHAMATRAADYKVLLIDAGLSATLPVIRALRADGAAVRLAVAEGAIGAARLAGGCAGYVRHPRLEDADAVFERLLAFIRQHGIDVVLPLSDAATAALDRVRGRLERHVALAIPPAAAVADTMDKGRTLGVARRVPETFAVPATLEPEGPHAVDPAQVRSWPVLVKPRDADGARGIHLVAEAQGLRDVYADVDRTFPRPLIQELIPYRPGEKYQLYYLFDATGVPRARFMQRILEEANAIVGPDGTQRRGGISLLWESALDEDLLARGQRLLAAMGWRGTAFVEVVRDRRDGVVKLLEINPRLSGSIHLCLAVGPNLAAAACRVALGLPVAAGWYFAVGRRARRDLFHLLAARAWRLMLDPRNLPPYRLLADPLPVAAASMGRLGRGIGSSASAG